MSYNIFAKYYDHLTENVDYKVRSDYISNFLTMYGIKDGLLLDLACGTGQMSILFAQKGYDVIGIDASPDMLCKAQGNVAMTGMQPILFLCQQMEQINLYGTIRACICTLDSINHLTSKEAVSATFQRVSLFMEQGGIFVFDVNSLYKHHTILADNTFVYEEEDVFLVWRNAYDAASQAVEINLDFFEKEEGTYYREQEQFTEYAYDTPLLCQLLIKSGFEVLGTYDELRMEEAHETSQRIYFVARKL